MVAGVDLPFELIAVALIAGMVAAWVALRPILTSMFSNALDALPNVFKAVHEIWSGLMAMGGVIYDHTVGAALDWAPAITTDVSNLAYALDNLRQFVRAHIGDVANAVAGSAAYALSVAQSAAARIAGFDAWVNRVAFPTLEAHARAYAAEAAGAVRAEVAGDMAWINNVAFPTLEAHAQQYAAAAAAVAAAVGARVTALESEAEDCFRPTCDTVGNAKGLFDLWRTFEHGMMLASLAEILAKGPEWFIQQVLGAATSDLGAVEGFVVHWLGGDPTAAPPGPSLSLPGAA